MNYSTLFNRSLALFQDKSKAVDLRMLIRWVFNLTDVEFWTRGNETITDTRALNRFYYHRRRLLNNEPPAYILKQKEFFGETFFVNKRVLIPRPETELLVEGAIKRIRELHDRGDRKDRDEQGEPVAVLDIGSGSGVIAVTLALRTGCRVVAVEQSPGAMRVLKKNIRLHGLGDKIKPVLGDLFPSAANRFDVIVSNPPYIPLAEWRRLDPNVRDYEPVAALVAGEDGLDIIRRIVGIAPYFLKPDGGLMMEIGHNQKKAVARLLEAGGFRDIGFVDDYAGIPRIVSATRGT